MIKNSLSKRKAKGKKINKICWIFDLNWLTDIFIISVLTEEGKLFQAYAALTWKVRIPEFEFNLGTAKVLLVWLLVDSDVNDYHEKNWIEIFICFMIPVLLDTFYTMS